MPRSWYAVVSAGVLWFFPCRVSVIVPSVAQGSERCLFVLRDCFPVPCQFAEHKPACCWLPSPAAPSRHFQSPACLAKGFKKATLNIAARNGDQEFPLFLVVLGLGHLVFLVGTEHPCWGCWPPVAQSSGEFPLGGLVSGLPFPAGV